ncbi:hypothetical protein Pla52o_39330 [Novipirellula galeiformis]|uniref:Zinc-binding domain of primase-helicase n=1 Tax=Novipirellula galeiformis TaxID=2528004 RepID=A0A5C6CEM0_9BACT|nr:hypothetical protein [Novipirellula galeiformis]TWU21746.1 hypothetical protein Pla52o_39330 [Novipirellula galeiformis]
MNFSAIKEAAAGRCAEIIGALTPLPMDVVIKQATDHPCPRCKGSSVIWPDSRDGGANQHGRIACRNCTDNRPKGDIISTVAEFAGLSQGNSARAIADYLGLPMDQLSDEPAKRLSITEQVCKAKRMPVDAFEKYGVKEEERAGESVARVNVYDHHGEIHSHFDLSPSGKGRFKSGAGSSGLFLPGRLPVSGETWLMVEGVKDAAALTGLGYNAVGLPGSSLADKYANLFDGVSVVVVPDLDGAGMNGAQQTAGNLFGIAASVSIARLPGQVKAKGGDDVRDVLRREQGEWIVRDSIERAKLWAPAVDSLLDVTESTENTEVLYSTDSVHSVSSVDSVHSVTPDQFDALSAAIQDTASSGASKQNSGVFRFARKFVAIVGTTPSPSVVEKYGLFWFNAARKFSSDLDPGIVVAELHAAIDSVRFPDDGTDMVTRAWARSQENPKPDFVANYPDDSTAVRFAKFIVELDRLHDGATFFLSCRKAGTLTGLNYRQANRLLGHWVKNGTLDLVEKGKPGPPGSRANRFRLGSRFSASSNQNSGDVRSEADDLQSMGKTTEEPATIIDPTNVELLVPLSGEQKTSLRGCEVEL